MRYLMLIYATEGGLDDVPPDVRDAEMAKWFSYTSDLQAAGVMIAGDALQPVATATSVRVRDGATLTTDGPFAETKEALGGYYLIDVDGLDDALAWAARCPGAAYGTIEVRPLMEFDMPDGPDAP